MSTTSVRCVPAEFSCPLPRKRGGATSDPGSASAENGAPGASRARTIPLRAIHDRDSGLVGAKALNLARMMRAGLPVPPGFCVTGAAFQAHVDSAPLAERAKALLEEIEDGAAAGPVLAKLRAAIVEAPLADRLARQIEERYRALGAKHVAVRSSATVEDLPGHSFAGQYDTLLGVRGPADCLRAVGKCWASLWTERAYAYRERNGIEHRNARMAVIIQELVPAEVSGVLFTADPVSGRTDRVVIESCFGLGETLVSGKVTPDRLILSKRKLRVLDRVVATKKLETVLDSAGGARERPVADERAELVSLDDADARRLGKLALRAEKAFGAPQDVEWAAAAGKLYVLQARPITTLAPARSWQDRQIWSNTNTGEIFPDVVTPITWSVAKPFIEHAFRTITDAAGIELDGNPIMGLVAGRAYFNLTTTIGTMSALPFAQSAGDQMRETVRLLGGSEVAAEGLELISRDDFPQGRFGRLRILFKSPLFALWTLRQSPERALRLIAENARLLREVIRLDVASLPDEEILSRMRPVQDGFMKAGSALMCVMTAMAYFRALAEVCRWWLGDANGSLAKRLVGGLSGLQSAEAGLALWRLAELAGRHRGVAAAVRSEQSFEAARARMASQPGGSEFLEAWRAFMIEHGHHTRGELEFANPRWAEEPDRVLGMVRGYLENSGGETPTARHARLAAERERLTRECRAKLRNPIKRATFNHLLRKAQLGCLARENGKSEAVRGGAAVRRMLLELGRRLVERGVVQERDDVFFLCSDELEPVVRGTQAFDVRAAVRERRADYDRNCAITPPPVVVGRFDPEKCATGAVDESATAFEGIASSPGSVTGPARVVTRAGEESVGPGEILVAPFTDPGWTPYIVNAAGIVMDQGGLLSHGSIIAREYGIPAVVNVGPATKVVKTGQMLRVDGDRGRVQLITTGQRPEA
jgi:pyruvate,water dikinase